MKEPNGVGILLALLQTDFQWPEVVSEAKVVQIQLRSVRCGQAVVMVVSMLHFERVL
jgi:hypothetical protein